MNETDCREMEEYETIKWTRIEIEPGLLKKNPRNSKLLRQKDRRKRKYDDPYNGEQILVNLLNYYRIEPFLHSCRP